MVKVRLFGAAYLLALCASPAQAGCNPATDEGCAFIIGGATELTPAEKAAARERAVQKETERRDIARRETQWLNRLGKHRAAEARRMAEMEAAADRARKKSVQARSAAGTSPAPRSPPKVQSPSLQRRLDAMHEADKKNATKPQVKKPNLEAQERCRQMAKSATATARCA